MNCKSVVFALALASLATAPALAQRAAVTNAIMEQRAGRLDKARTEIDKAVTDDKTGAEAKTWYTRGEIYEGLLTNPIYKKTAPADAAQTAYDSFQKSVELDAKGKEYAPQAKEHIKGLYGMAFNAGVAAYNEKNYPAAIAQYQLAAKINPQDTTAVLYTAYAHEASQNPAGAVESYRNVLKMGHKTQQIYGRILALSADKPDQEQLDIAREALTAYPNSVPFMLQEISLMLKMGKEQEAISKIQSAIKADPKNSNLYAVLGSLYDKTGKSEEAVKVYQQAIDADPTNFDAQFNLGVYQFNKGAELINKTRKMSPQEYTKQNGKKIEADAKGYFEKSVPYFEAALRIKGCDKGALQSLQKAYVTLNKLPDAERIQKQSDDCGSGTSNSSNASTTRSGSTIELPLISQGGIYVAAVKVNGIAPIDFVFDTGASETTVTADVVMTMIRQKLVKPEDFLPGKEYKLADGSIVNSPRFKLKTLEVGGIVFKDVEVGISNSSSEPLLGQNVLGRFSRVIQDTQRKKLVLEVK